MSATIRENLLVTMGVYAGDMNREDAIDLPHGVDGEDELANFCVECVDNFIERDNSIGRDDHGMDISFEEYAIVCLLRKYGKREEESVLDMIDDEYWEGGSLEQPTFHVVATAGRVEKILFEGSREQCEMFCDDFGWKWSEEPGGFVWDLEVEEI